MAKYPCWITSEEAKFIEQQKMLTHTLSAMIEADYRMPKSTEDC